MKKNISRALLLIIVLTLLLSTVAFAATEASYYLQYYNGYITKTGNTIKVNFDVQGTKIMDKVGVTEIYLYERANSSSSWTLVQTYLSTDPTYSSTMMGTNTNYHYDYVTYSGSSSKQYYAYVTCYAEKDGGSDSRSFIAPE